MGCMGRATTQEQARDHRPRLSTHRCGSPYRNLSARCMELFFILNGFSYGVLAIGHVPLPAADDTLSYLDAKVRTVELACGCAMLRDEASADAAAVVCITPIPLLPHLYPRCP